MLCWISDEKVLNEHSSVLLDGIPLSSESVTLVRYHRMDLVKTMGNNNLAGLAIFFHPPTTVDIQATIRVENIPYGYTEFRRKFAPMSETETSSQLRLILHSFKEKKALPADVAVYHYLLDKASQITPADPGEFLEKEYRFSLDTHYLSNSNILFINGWINDAGDIFDQNGTIYLNGSALSPNDYILFRYYRSDIQVDSEKKARGETRYPNLSGCIMIIQLEDVPDRFTFTFRDPSGSFCLFSKRGKELTAKKARGLLIEYANIMYDNPDFTKDEKDVTLRWFIKILDGIQQEILESIDVEETIQWGHMPEDPEVSIVIPIYKSYELIRYQYTDFAHDPYLRRQDIVFVLDDPDDARWVKTLFGRLYERYQMSCRLLVMNENGGFGKACNTGVLHSKGRYLLLLNSDIFPQQNGWLEKMLDVLKGDMSVGIVGARLLNNDGSIQHVEVSWRREQFHGNVFLNIHPFKGYPTTFLPLKGAVEVNAVTGACMLMRRQEFMELGMLDTSFIFGDFEDTDLCLKTRKKGKRIICLHDAVLYHCEGSSYEGNKRSKIFPINVKKHFIKWENYIEELLQKKAQS